MLDKILCIESMGEVSANGGRIRDMTELLKTPGRLRGKTPRTARQQLRQVEVSRHRCQSVAFSIR